MRLARFGRRRARLGGEPFVAGWSGGLVGLVARRACCGAGWACAAAAALARTAAGERGGCCCGCGAGCWARCCCGWGRGCCCGSGRGAGAAAGLRLRGRPSLGCGRWLRLRRGPGLRLRLQAGPGCWPRLRLRLRSGLRLGCRPGLRLCGLDRLLRPELTGALLLGFRAGALLPFRGVAHCRVAGAGRSAALRLAGTLLRLRAGRERGAFRASDGLHFRAGRGGPALDCRLAGRCSFAG